MKRILIIMNERKEQKYNNKILEARRREAIDIIIYFGVKSNGLVLMMSLNSSTDCTV